MPVGSDPLYPPAFKTENIFNCPLFSLSWCQLSVPSGLFIRSHQS